MAAKIVGWAKVLQKSHIPAIFSVAHGPRNAPAAEYNSIFDTDA
jgi:hypothetical protein